MHDGMTFEAHLDGDKENLFIDLKFPSNYYVGIGFGDSMTEAPMLVVDATDENMVDTPIIHDAYSAGHGRPADNTQNIYTLVSSELDGSQWSVTLSRPVEIIREGRNETLVFMEKIDMIWAFKESDYGHHGRGDRGQFHMTIDRASGNAFFGDEIPSGDIYFKVHGILMYMAWSIMTFISIVSGRYMKHFYNFRMIIHASTGLLIAVNTVVLVLFAITKYGAEGSNPTYAHKPIGIIIMAVSVIQCVGGMTVRTLMTSFSLQNIWSNRAKIGHQIFGYLLIIFSNFQVVTGLNNYQSPVENLIYLHFAI